MIILLDRTLPSNLSMRKSTKKLTIDDVKANLDRCERTHFIGKENLNLRKKKMKEVISKEFKEINKNNR